MSKTKIVVVKLKEILITAALVFLGILAVMLVIALISVDKETTPGIQSPASASSNEASALYYPGVYTSSLSVGDSTVHLELVCDSNHINSVRLLHLDDAVETMYPLLNPALEDLELQLSKDVPVEELVLTDGSQYTQTLLIEAIEETLKKAGVAE